jgi:hypothetical protein
VGLDTEFQSSSLEGMFSHDQPGDITGSLWIY